MNFLNKKGQGLSLTTIIVAAIALIVLVVLVMIFTGRIGVFKSGVEKAGGAELTTLKISYGDCHPTSTKELAFTAGINKAKSEVAKQKERDLLKTDIATCKVFTSQSTCTGGGCAWK